MQPWRCVLAPEDHILTRVGSTRIGFDRFVLLNRISSIDRRVMRAERRIDTTTKRPLLWLESLAQAAAFHCRWTIEFSAHVFLARLRNATVPFDSPTGANFLIESTIDASSASACRAHVVVRASSTSESCASATVSCASATILLGIRPFDDQFRESLLSGHYRGIFACLRGE